MVCFLGGCLLLKSSSHAPALSFLKTNSTIHSSFSLSVSKRDCSPARFDTPSGLAAARLLYDQGGVNFPMYLFGSFVGVIVDSILGAAHLRRLSQSLDSPRVVSASHQFMYFENDPVITSSFIKGVAENFRKAGSKVDIVGFPERDHVRILRIHPEEATRIMQSFVDSFTEARVTHPS